MGKDMLTLFTTPKAFQGHFGVIQRNALRSWTLVKPRPEIIVIGNDPGTREVCEELGLRHVPEVETNEYGTPLLSAIFAIGQGLARYPLTCYINSDIILTSSFLAGLQRAAQSLDGRPFLVIGRRWNVFLDHLWDFSNPDWEQALRRFAIEHGYWESAGATDYFLFPREVDWRILPFGVGRSAWDGWFLYNAKAIGIPVIDASEIITVYHQQHDYSHLRGGKLELTDGEFRRNQRLRGSLARQYNIWDSSLLLTARGLEPAPPKRWAMARLLRLRMFLTYYVHAFHPFSYPVVWSYREARKLVRLCTR
jgi:hypothetical protein